MPAELELLSVSSTLPYSVSALSCSLSAQLTLLNVALSCSMSARPYLLSGSLTFAAQCCKSEFVEYFCGTYRFVDVQEDRRSVLHEELVERSDVEVVHELMVELEEAVLQLRPVGLNRFP